jgi:hypothetical protein
MCRRSRFSRTARAASSNCNGSDDRSTRDSTSALRHTSASMTGLFAQLCLLWHHIKGANASAVTERTVNRVAEFMQKFLHAVTFYTSILGVSDNHDGVPGCRLHLGKEADARRQSRPELSGAPLQGANPRRTVWDERGYRISPRLPSAFAFTRHYEMPQQRGAHWSR